MTLFELLIAICFFIAVEAAYMSANHLRLGFLGHALALVIGIMIGFGFAWAMWRSFVKAGTLVDTIPKRLQGLCSVGIILLSIVWIVAAGFIGAIVPPAILRLIF